MKNLCHLDCVLLITVSDFSQNASSKPLNTLLRTKIFLYWTVDKEHKWFERGINEAIYVRKLKKTPLNKGGSLRHVGPNKSIQPINQENPKRPRSSDNSTSYGNSLNGKDITWREEASRMRCYTVATRVVTMLGASNQHSALIINRHFTDFLAFATGTI